MNGMRSARVQLDAVGQGLADELFVTTQPLLQSLLSTCVLRLLR